MRVEKIILVISGYLLLFFSYFPYLDFLSLGTVTQPNAMLISFVPLLFLKDERLPIESFLLFFTLGFASILLLFSNFSFLVLRDLMNYVSLFTISIATFKILKYSGGLSYRLFYSAVVVWFLGSVLQKVYSLQVFSFILHKVRGLENEAKGLTSLATEPTYYGLIMGLFFVIYLLNEWHKKSTFLGLLILVQIFIVAKSSTVLAITFASLGAFIFLSLLQLKARYLVFTAIGVLLFVLVSPFIFEWLEATRMYELSLLAYQNPELIFARDFSVSERVNHAWFPIVSLFDNALMPGGYGNFGDYLTANKESGNYPVLFSHSFFRPSNRIMSGYGKVFFELGGIGLLVPLVIVRSFWFGLKKPAILFACIYFNLLLFAALPFMTATVPFIIGITLYLRHQHFAAKEQLPEVSAAGSHPLIHGS